MKIAVDAMGGDKAPHEIVKGAVIAAQRFPDDEVLLVGDEKKIQQELGVLGAVPRNVTIHHASQIVGMDDPATYSIRQKSDSSITRSVKLVANGEASAVVSAGHTGATVADQLSACARSKVFIAPALPPGFLPGMECVSLWTWGQTLPVSPCIFYNTG